MPKRSTRTRTARAEKGLFSDSPPTFEPQTIYCGDNLRELKDFPDACVDLVYIDPPFNSNRNYEVFWGEARETRAFEDRHASTQAYIEFMRPRCEQLARVLKPTGSFFYHCDWHASHYIKVMLDQIFGEDNFLNEIIWKRNAAHSNAKQGAKFLGRIHDVIFFYANGKHWTFNTLFNTYSASYIETHYRNIEPVSGRRYRKDNLTANKGGGDTSYEWKGARPYAGRYWAYSKAKMKEFEDAGRIVYTKSGMPEYKRYLDEMPGPAMQDVWDDIDPLNSQSLERVGYPTQKPVVLLERIVDLGSNPGDVVLDAFCGCGTALVAAETLGRKWVGIDMSPTACRVMADRLELDCGLLEGTDFRVYNNMMLDEKTLRRIPPFEFENWAVVSLGGTPNRAKVGDMGIDGKLFPASVIPEKIEGGFDFMDHWYPIQVKQKDKAGRPDIDLFETAMRRAGRNKGFFVSFDYTQDAEDEMRNFFFREGREIVPVKVSQILRGEIPIRLSV